jgi:uncharacterized cupredoxin-like copper-binding protein
MNTTPTRQSAGAARQLASCVAGTALAALLAGCAAAGSAGWSYAPLGPTPSAGASGTVGPSASPSTSGSPAASGSAGANVIELEENSSLQILQDGQQITELQLTIGQTYTFRINNTAGFSHDFYLGPPDRLQANDVAGLPGVPTNSLGVQEFTWTATADARGWGFACTEPGHYQNMHGTLVLEGG